MAIPQTDSEEAPPAGVPRRELPLQQVRFPIFAKLITAFVVVIVFMISSSVYLLFQLRDALDTPATEILQLRDRNSLTQDLKKKFELEIEALRLAQGGDSAALTVYRAEKVEFLRQSDLLSATMDRADLRSVTQTVGDLHRRLTDSLERKLAAGTLSERELREASSAMSVQFGKQEDAFQGTLNKTLRVFKGRTANAVDGAGFVLLLSFVIAICIAFLLAHNVTRPIRLLKAGTEKVAEGKYETVKVTSADEIADLTAAFNTMSEKLRQLDEMRMQMMSEISHEMRTPLQVIKAACYSIAHQREGTPLTQKQSDALGMIHQATNRITSFVNSFLDVAKLEAGLMKFNFEPMEIGHILAPIVSEAQLIGQARQIAVTCELDPVPPLPLDKDRMIMVFTNLLSNALKFTPEQGTIAVRVLYRPGQGGEAAPGRVAVEVQDTGVGIPPADLEKLFNKFYQAKNTPQVKEKGSGLGLALVKHIVEAHGGKVSVESTVGKGSTFRIVLPVRAPVLSHHTMLEYAAV